MTLAAQERLPRKIRDTRTAEAIVDEAQQPEKYRGISVGMILGWAAMIARSRIDWRRHC